MSFRRALHRTRAGSPQGHQEAAWRTEAGRRHGGHGHRWHEGHSGARGQEGILQLLTQLSRPNTCCPSAPCRCRASCGTRPCWMLMRASGSEATLAWGSACHILELQEHACRWKRGSHMAIIPHGAHAWPLEYRWGGRRLCHTCIGPPPPPCSRSPLGPQQAPAGPSMQEPAGDPACLPA